MSLPGPPEEGDTLLDLGRLRRPLEEEDVRERMARPEHRNVELVTQGEQLIAELVDLGDRLAQVTLVDLVGRGG